jgi:hypothetical protein
VQVIIVTKDGQHIPMPEGIEVLVETEKGRANARNSGAARAIGPMLFFLDGDVTPYPALFHLSPEPGWFYMSKVYDYPCSRVVIIGKVDFERVGGFDGSTDGAEDIDFYFRCLDAGLRFSEVPASLYHHVDHPRDREYGRLIADLRVALRHLRRHPDFMTFEIRRKLKI